LFTQLLTHLNEERTKMKAATAKSTSQVKLDQAKLDGFAERMVRVLNDAGLALMTSIGHRTRLFEVMSGLEPSPVTTIARTAGLNERYVKEWLGAMVTGSIIDYDATNRTYSLPAEHAALLTPAATPNNIAVPAQFIAILGDVEDRIVNCFRNGGGVPYSEYKRFHEVMAEESSQTVGAVLLDSILPLVPELKKRLQDQVTVLDVGCGSGKTMNLLAATFPTSNFTGYDLSREAIAAARHDAKDQQLNNAKFKVQDVATLQEKEKYDLITAFDSIHDQARPQDVLNNIAKALKPNGVFLMQDIAGSSLLENNLDRPLGPFGYTISCMHCMSVSLAQDGEGLGAMWGQEKASEMLKRAGFDSVEVHSLPHDILNSYYVVQK
jgi:2-polyprenyl-3-methyl-5-hydroxy-6-metoxy-1,4-benzoquinol methylase